MIGLLKGILIVKEPNRVVVDVNGVGYEVSIPLSTFYGLGDEGSGVELEIHTHVREEAFDLYGFLSSREKDIFKHLISISGVGPKMAVAILSGLGVDDIVLSISGGDVSRLTSIPGVGKKTAERVVLELKEKVTALSRKERDDLSMKLLSGEVKKKKEDLTSALVNLGYKRSVAERAADKATSGDYDQPLEVLLKKTLKSLSG